ncbi:hypothetical protein KC333_g2407 [Hortaea werneckii]|nr:hypothetical protein KC333_g2407 [Hortaea werneckii]KAI7319831.1 hypothetical protein KC326_g2987 [Hortaea werneckii]
MDPSRSGQWVWSEQGQRYYYLDALTKEIVDQNGMRLPPSHAHLLGPEHPSKSRREEPGSFMTVQSVTPVTSVVTAEMPLPSMRSVQTQQSVTPVTSVVADRMPLPSMRSVQTQQSVTPATSVVADRMPLPSMRSVQTQQSAYNLRRLSTPYRHADFSLQKREEERLEELAPSFTIRRDTDRFFKPGRVFLVLWTEPAGTLSKGACSEDVVTARFGERAFSRIRRFVVVRAANSYCSALPIVTYSGRGVGKPGVKKSEHCIKYTGHSSPVPLREEIPRDGEAGMRLISIRVIPDDHVTKLDPVSRLDLGKPYTINHNIKVKAFGQVDALHLTALLSQFNLVWSVPSPSVHTPPPGGNPPRAAARVQKLHEAATKEEESSSNEEEDDTTENEGERHTSTPKDPDLPIDFSLFDELKALQVNHVKILQLGELFGALKCSGFDTDAITVIAAAQNKSERASAVSRACKHSAQVGKDPGIQPSKLRKVTYDALLRRGYSEEQANNLLDSQLS